MSPLRTKSSCDTVSSTNEIVRLLHADWLSAPSMILPDGSKATETQEYSRQWQLDIVHSFVIPARGISSIAREEIYTAI